MYETFRLVQMVFCGHNVMYHHTIMCFTLMLKGILVMMLHKWNPKFEFLHEFFENFKPNWQGMVQTSFGM